MIHRHVLRKHHICEFHIFSRKILYLEHHLYHIDSYDLSKTKLNVKIFENDRIYNKHQREYRKNYDKFIYMSSTW